MLERIFSNSPSQPFPSDPEFRYRLSLPACRSPPQERPIAWRKSPSVPCPGMKPQVSCASLKHKVCEIRTHVAGTFPEYHVVRMNQQYEIRRPTRHDRLQRP